MDIKNAYNIWAQQYDTNKNRTRDLEAQAIKTVLGNADFEQCLEIGCGTGKNTGWLLTKAKQVTGVDLSEEMLEKARSKFPANEVQFLQADITGPWTFADRQFDLVTFSLVLEHIEDLNDIFKKLCKVVKPGGLVYLGELHPFKQYSGTKARFETESGLEVVTCFNHNITDFTVAASANGFVLAEIAEFFDQDDRTTIPRILALLLRKEKADTDI